MVIQVVVIDDHPLVREALVGLLHAEPDLEVVGAAADADEAAALLERVCPDVVVMDIDLPGVDGITATRALLARDPSPRVVMLSAACTPDLIRQAAAAGACGYLLKGDPPEQLAEGVRAAARGEHPMGRDVVELCRIMEEARAAGQGRPKVAAASLWAAALS